MEAIRTDSLTKYYGKSRGIIDLDLSVQEGECFGFIGPNGAGKSTTIRTLLGLISPTSGSGTVFGKDIVRDSTEVRKEIGYLPSEAIFWHGMKVRDILRFSADLRKQDCAKEAEALCERLQLDMNEKTERLSFGNRKKAGIVCALQSKPRLLLLDEPTGGLDPLMQREFFKILEERNKQGTTIFLSSHILSEIQRSCARAAVIREGRIIDCGRIEDLSRSSARRVTVSGSFELNGLEGIRALREEENSASFLYSGDLNLLLKKLSEADIHDLSISEPDLEEIFLHYYEKEDDAS